MVSKVGAVVPTDCVDCATWIRDRIVSGGDAARLAFTQRDRQSRRV